MKIKRIFFKSMLLMMALLLLSACWNRRELNELSVVMGMALDATDEPGRLKLTSQIVKTGAAQAMEKGGAGQKNNMYWDKVNYGYGIMQTLRGYTNEVSRKLYLPHNEIIIVGRALAEQGLKDHVDFFLRDHETRVDVKLLIADGEAGEVLGLYSELEAIPAFNLSKLLTVQRNTSNALEVNVAQFICTMSSKAGIGTMPLVYVLDGNEDETSEDKKRPHISGAGVFKDYKLIGELNQEENRGMMWLASKVKGGVLTVGAPGGVAEIEILSSSCKLKPVIREDGTLEINATIQVNCSLASQTGKEDLAFPPNIKALEIAIVAKVKDEVNNTLRTAKEMQADVFHFADEFYRHYPDEWGKMETRWEEYFPSVIVNMDVTAKLRSMGRITKPMYAN